MPMTKTAMRRLLFVAAIIVAFILGWIASRFFWIPRAYELGLQEGVEIGWVAGKNGEPLPE